MHLKVHSGFKLRQSTKQRGFSVGRCALAYRLRKNMAALFSKKAAILSDSFDNLPDTGSPLILINLPAIAPIEKAVS